MTLLEIAKKYFPDARMEMTATKSDPTIRERYFITKRNKGSFSKEGIQYRIKQEKIERIMKALGIEYYASKTSNSVYFEYEGLKMRLSDHKASEEFFGFDYLVTLNTDENEIIRKIKTLTPNFIKL